MDHRQVCIRRAWFAGHPNALFGGFQVPKHRKADDLLVGEPNQSNHPLFGGFWVEKPRNADDLPSRKPNRLLLVVSRSKKVFFWWFPGPTRRGNHPLLGGFQDRFQSQIIQIIRFLVVSGSKNTEKRMIYSGAKFSQIIRFLVVLR